MPRHRARADERDLNEPAVVPAGLGRHFFGGSTATATASVYSASIWWMVRSKLKIFLNPSGLRSSTPCSVDWILETHAHADHLSGARTVDVDDLDQRVHRVDSLAAHRPRGPSRLWNALDGQTVGDDG